MLYIYTKYGETCCKPHDMIQSNKTTKILVFFEEYEEFSRKMLNKMWNQTNIMKNWHIPKNDDTFRDSNTQKFVFIF